MPNGKRDQSRNRITPQHERTQSGASSGAVSRLQEGASHVGDSVREGYDAARENVARQYERAEGLIASYPAPSVLIGFGLGLGLGILLTMSFTQREDSAWSRWHLPDSLRDLPERMRHVPESLARHMPESIARHIR